MIGRFAWLILFFSMTWTGGLTIVASGQAQELAPGAPLAREIAGGQEHLYSVSLGAGQFARAVIEQQGIDLVVTLLGPDGKPIFASDRPTGAHGQESVSHEAGAAGVHQLRVRPLAAEAPKGRYVLTLELRPAAAAADRKRIEAERLLAEASQLGRVRATVETALARAEQARALWREIGDGYWASSAASEMAAFLIALGKNPPAIELAAETLAEKRGLGDRVGEGLVLMRLARAQAAAQRLPEAIASYERAIALYRELQDPGNEAFSLLGLAALQYQMRRYEKAIEPYERAILLFRELRRPADEAASLYRLSETLATIDDRPKAIARYEQALQLYRELKNALMEGRTLARLANTQMMEGKYDPASAYARQALVLGRQTGDLYTHSGALILLGTINSSLDRYDEAAVHLQEALTLQREKKLRQDEGDTLGRLAAIRHAQGRLDEARQLLEASLEILREVRYRYGEGLTLLTLTSLEMISGRPGRALSNVTQARAIFQELRLRSEEAMAVSAMGYIYYILGSHDRSLERFQEAEAIYRELKNRPGEVNSRMGAAMIRSVQGQYEQATILFDQALALARETGGASASSTVLMAIGEHLSRQRRYAEAQRAFAESLQFQRKAGVLLQEGYTLSQLGKAERESGRLLESVATLEQGVRTSRQVRDRFGEAEALAELMYSWKARKQPRLAIYYGKQAINLAQTGRATLVGLDQQLQQNFLKSKEPIYRELADLLIAEGRLPEAEQVITLLKQEEYFEFIRRDGPGSSDPGKSTLTPEEAALEKRYGEIADQLAALGAERGRLLEKKTRTPEEETRLAKLDADLVVAGNAFQKFLDQLSAELGGSKEGSARAYQARESQGLMEDLRELGPGTVALYTLIGEDKYRVILTTPDFQKGYEVPIGAAELNRKVLAFRQALQSPKYDPQPLARELYGILVAPMARDLEAAKATTLMWSLDGVLRYVPIAALHDGTRYLVERFNNVVFTPASQARLKDAPAGNWDVLGLGVSKSHGERIPALPGVVEEMRGIIREEGSGTGVLPGAIKLDEQFTQETMLNGLRRRFKVVHIASHFQFQPGNEANSALLLGDGSFLSLAQIKTLPNVFGGVDLLTLSACNTATGGAANGREVEGFGVLAQRQGAKSVVASLWPVFDASTKILMQDFYRLRETAGTSSKIEALRQAQLRLLRGEATIAAAPNRELVHEAPAPAPAAQLPRFAPDPKRPYGHPYFWAPFIMIGNWR